MVSCFKRLASLSLLALTISCGQDGYAPGLFSVLTFSGTVTTIAGLYQDSQSQDGSFTTARFNSPRMPNYDGSRYVYVIDAFDSIIRRLDTASQTVTTVAGSVGVPGNADGIGTAARFSTPTDMAIVGNYAYITDSSNHRIRRMDLTTYAVTTFAGGNTFGNANGTGTAATFNFPVGIATDGTNLYVTDNNNHRIRKIVIATAAVTTFAGSSMGNTEGTGTAAQFSSPFNIECDGKNVYVGDQSGTVIRRVTLAGVVTTLAGIAGSSNPTDGVGTAGGFGYVAGMKAIGDTLYVTDSSGAAIRMVDLNSREVTTLAGDLGNSGSVDGVGTAASFDFPYGIELVESSLWVASTSGTIRQID